MPALKKVVIQGPEVLYIFKNETITGSNIQALHDLRNQIGKKQLKQTLYGKI